MGEHRSDVDVVVVGAGMAGLYLLHKLRSMGLSAQGFETGDGVGGTWYWNRYPGARCDVESIDYSYSFDVELDQEWTWSERYACQPEILSYLEHVADRFDLKRDIRFSTKIEQAAWDDDTKRWSVITSDGDTVTCQHYVMASGCLSVPKTLDIDGHERFGGEVYFTSRWPHEGVDFTGKRVAVVGTGSSAIQAIPVIASEAAELTVYQRTPNFSLPAHNGPHLEDKVAAIKADRAGYRESQRWSRGGVPGPRTNVGALTVSDEERNAAYEAGWEQGGLFSTLGTFADLLTNPESNATIAEFVRNKIRDIVDDPEVADSLCPTNHPLGTKRPCLDDNYYAVYNQPHVSLVDLLKDPIATVSESGIETSNGTRHFDVIVFATGFDAMTGALVSVDIRGKGGVSLADAWADGPQTYLGLTVSGFPNFFAITGPGSPSVLSNMVVSIEQHVEWICDAVVHLRTHDFDTIEATEPAQIAWGQHVFDFANLTLYPQANSWYMGANVPGKPRVFLPYVGGVDAYRQACNEVVEQGYLGFELSGDAGVQRSEDRVRPLKPDVQILLDTMAAMNLPTLESMSPAEARAFSEAGAQQRPPGPDVGEIVDGMYPGADGELAYRLYRPATPGPHPVVAYFHGGGWVLGSSVSDDPLCRDLCNQTDALVVSFDYRHAPEHCFPAAPHDAYAAVQWLAEHAEKLGGRPDKLAVAGWSAGANLTAVVCQLVRDGGGPEIAGQVMLTPVTDGSRTYPSLDENAEGYILTKSLMRWFWEHYADESERSDVLASPLLASSLEGLAPAMVVTAEFDPLRDEGDAYAAALAAAGVKVRHLQADGQTHTSMSAVDVIATGAYVRSEMAAALRDYLA